MLSPTQATQECPDCGATDLLVYGFACQHERCPMFARPPAISLAEMFIGLRRKMEFRQEQLAAALDCSPQFICDVEKGRRIPSVAMINRLCDWLDRGPAGRREWHAAAARAHGWEI